MKKFFVALAIAIGSYLPINAQNYASTFVNAIVSLSSGYSSSQMSNLMYNHYGVPTSNISIIYSSFGNNWGNVSIVLEISRAFGLSVDKIYDAYRQYPNQGWPFIVNKLGYDSNTTLYKTWYNSLSNRRTYWDNTFKQYKQRKNANVAAREKRSVNQSLYSGFNGKQSTKNNNGQINNRQSMSNRNANTGNRANTNNNNVGRSNSPSNNSRDNVNANTSNNNRTTKNNANNSRTNQAPNANNNESKGAKQQSESRNKTNANQNKPQQQR